MAEIFDDDNKKIQAELLKCLTSEDRAIALRMSEVFSPAECRMFGSYLLASERHKSCCGFLEKVVLNELALRVSLLRGGRKEVLEGAKSLNPAPVSPLGTAPSPVEHRGIIQRIKEAFRGKPS